MKLGRANETARHGFTLIELLVVIAIITILMSLLLAAVMRVTVKAEEVQTRNDISQLVQATASFKVKYGTYIPSRFYMGKSKSDFAAHGRLGTESYQYITNVWRHIPWSDSSGKDIVYNWPTGYMEGQQCLVFFLGGPPVGSAITGGNAPAGFSSDPSNPFKPPTTGEERVTFYDFPANRLSWATTFIKSGSPFPCFLDAYKWPYAYFGSYKTDNGYNRYRLNSAADAGWANGSDCVTLGVWPYAESVTPALKYLNPSTYQIISAGRDKTFGRGYQLNPMDGANSVNNLWSAKNPLTHALYNTTGSNTTAGNDDVSNFHELMLGIPAN